MQPIIRKIFSKPEFSDPDKTRVALLIWTMNMILLAGTIFICTLFIFLDPPGWLRSLAIGAVVLTITLISFHLLNRKHLKAASGLLVFNVFQGLVINAWLYVGIRGNNGACFILLLIITGLLLG
mgnify:FL=1